MEKQQFRKTLKGILPATVEKQATHANTKKKMEK